MSRISLWDNNFDLIAAEECTATPSGRAVVTGEGPIYHYLRHHRGSDFNMTIDLSPNDWTYGPRRINRKVGAYTIRRYPCECGENTITTTTIDGHDLVWDRNTR